MHTRIVHCTVHTAQGHCLHNRAPNARHTVSIDSFNCLSLPELARSQTAPEKLTRTHTHTHTHRGRHRAPSSRSWQVCFEPVPAPPAVHTQGAPIDVGAVPRLIQTMGVCPVRNRLCVCVLCEGVCVCVTMCNFIHRHNIIHVIYRCFRYFSKSTQLDFQHNFSTNYSFYLQNKIVIINILNPFILSTWVQPVLSKIESFEYYYPYFRIADIKTLNWLGYRKSRLYWIQLFHLIKFEENLQFIIVKKTKLLILGILFNLNRPVCLASSIMPFLKVVSGVYSLHCMYEYTVQPATRLNMLQFEELINMLFSRAGTGPAWLAAKGGRERFGGGEQMRVLCVTIFRHVVITKGAHVIYPSGMEIPAHTLPSLTLDGTIMQPL